MKALNTLFAILGARTDFHIAQQEGLDLAPAILDLEHLIRDLAQALQDDDTSESDLIMAINALRHLILPR